MDAPRFSSGWIQVDGSPVSLIALPELLALFYEGRKPATPATARELLGLARSFNSIPSGEEQAYIEGLLAAYQEYLAGRPRSE